jgi:hypothetical protein
MEFFKKAVRVFAKPILLLVDGHGSHYDADAVTSASDDNVVVMTFPAHVTHVLQPLDVGIFHNFKSSLHKAIETHMEGKREVSKADIARLVKIAWNTSMTKDNITAGFRDSGIWPVDPDRVLNSGKLSPSIALSTNQESASIVLPTFSKKHKEAVEKTLEAAKATHRVYQPLMGLAIEAALEAEDSRGVPSAEGAAPVAQASSAPEPPKPASPPSISKPTSIQILDKMIQEQEKSGADKNMKRKLQDLREQLVEEKAGQILKPSSRVNSSEPPKKKTKQYLRSNGQAEVLTYPEALSRLKAEQEEREAKKRKPTAPKVSDSKSSPSSKVKEPAQTPQASSSNPNPPPNKRQKRAPTTKPATANTVNSKAVQPSEAAQMDIQ